MEQKDLEGSEEILKNLPKDLPPDTRAGDIPELQPHLEAQARRFVEGINREGGLPYMTVAEQTNGHAKGRAVPPLPLHTFQDSGITVGIRKIAPSTQQRLHDMILREHPKPTPPVVETELGSEENAADPDYLARLNEWKGNVNRMINARMYKLACLECEVEVDTQEVERKQAHFRAIGLDWEDDPNLSPEQNAKLFYIQHIACATTDDMKEFYEAVTRRSTPTEEAVARHIDTFRGDVQG